MKPDDNKTSLSSSSTPIRNSIWIICDKEKACNVIRQELQQLGFTDIWYCTAVYLSQNMGSILAKLEDDKPGLVWVSSLKADPGAIIDERLQISARLLVSAQLRHKGEIILEHATIEKDKRGVYFDPEWLQRNPQVNINTIWWCKAEGLRGNYNGKLHKLDKCAHTLVASTLQLPQNITTCCKTKTSTGRSHLPPRLPKHYYIAMSTLIQSSMPQHTTNLETFTATRKQKKKMPHPTADEGPGEHAEMSQVPQSHKTETTTDPNEGDHDCGDDVSMILDNILFSCFDTESEDDVEYNSTINMDHVFFTWYGIGSSPDDISLQAFDDRPNNINVDSMDAAFAAMAPGSHQHDMCELFGGQAGTTKLCIRQGLHCGPNFDISANINLCDPQEIKKLWAYLHKYRPKIIIAGPPCTAFGAWSRYNRSQAASHDTWQKNYKIGKALADLTAEIALWQLQNHRHFVIENPATSDMWALPKMTQVRQHENAVEIVCDQCMLGLRDPAGHLTRKSTKFLASDIRLIQRLGKRCDKSHYHEPLAGNVNGISRCKYAQVWPRRLLELLALGISETLSSSNSKQSSYPAVQSSSLSSEQPGICPGCRAHARKDDVRHDRRPGICKFPLSAERQWDCPSCRMHRGSTHTGHTFDETCQWSEAPVRRRGSTRLPPVLRDPKVLSNQAPEIPQQEPPALTTPPKVQGFTWMPLQNLEIIMELDNIRGRDGWHKFLEDGIALVWSNGRALRTSEPRFDASSWKYRTSYALFPDTPHDHGQYWILEDRVDYVAPEYITEMNYAFRFPIPVLIMVFHKSIGVIPSTPKENNTRTTIASTSTSNGGAPQSIGVEKRVQIAGEGTAEAFGAEEEPPPQLEAQPEPDIKPEWSHHDLGTALRDLRSENPAVINRALQRLHIRWWHATTARMTSLLKTAGVSDGVIKQIPIIVSTCKICRLWTRPNNRAMVSTRLAEKFGEMVQCDLLFFEDAIILHLLDESIRYTVTAILENKTAEAITSAITNSWIKLFGPMGSIVTDQESGLTSEISAIWAEKWNVSFRLRAKGQHATIVERHHQILRDHLHKIVAQSRQERLTIQFSEILSEATFIKNAMVNINGMTPYVALFGRFPHVFIDLEYSGQSSLQDSSGTAGGAGRHAVRLREIAVATIAETLAKNRLQRAEHHNSRPSAQVKDIHIGELVEIFRQPPNKDATGWRGPAEVIDNTTIDQGNVTVRWAGRSMIVRLQDIRKCVLFIAFTDSGSIPLQTIREHILKLLSGNQLFGWVSTPTGWQLSRIAKEYPDVLRAILHVARLELGITKCIGARLGRGIQTLPGLLDVEQATLFWWEANRPNLYSSVQHPGNQTIDMKPLVQKGDSGDICWIQFLSTSSTQARVLRQRNPDTTLLGHDPSEDENMEPDQDMTETATQMSTITTMPTQSGQPPPPQPPQQPHNHYQPQQPQDVYELPDEAWRQPVPDTPMHSHRTPTASQRSRTTRIPSSSSLPSTIHYPDNEKRPRPTDGTYRSDHKRQRHGQSSSSSTAQPSNPITPPQLQPTLPTHDDDDEFSDIISDTSTLDYGNFWVYHTGKSLEMVFLSEEGTPVIKKDLSELNAKQIKERWPEVCEAVRKELKSFIDQKTFVLAKQGTSGNTMTSRWLFKLKIVDGKIIVKGRLVIHGFKDCEAESLNTYAGTATRWGQRIICMVAATKAWPILTADVSTAFLRGLTFDELSRLTGEKVRRAGFHPPRGYESFVKELPGMEAYDRNVHELLMTKPVYGMKDAPRAWRIRLHQALTSLHYMPLKTDKALYYLYDQKQGITALISAHVDDLKITGIPSIIEKTIKDLTAMFGDLKIHRGDFEHCGIQHHQHEDMSITMDQNHYVKNLQLIDVTGIDASDGSKLLNASQHADYLSLLGGLAWLGQTRLDTAIYTQALQRAAQSPTVAHLLRLNTVVKWVRRKPASLFYRRLTGPLRVVVISDAAFRREDSSGLAIRGATIGVSEDSGSDNPGGNMAVIEWYARRQRRVVRSTFGAEINGLIDAIETGRLIAFTLAELVHPGISLSDLRQMDDAGKLTIPIHACTDCKSVFTALQSQDTHIPTESSLILIALQLKQLLVSGVLQSLFWIDTRDMVSDGLTKGLVSRKALMLLASTGRWKLLYPSERHQDFIPESGNDRRGSLYSER